MFTSSFDNDYFLESSKVSCNNMLLLAKKHQDQNSHRFKNLFNQHLCEQYSSNFDGGRVPSQWINNKHCDFIRDKYDMSFWDKHHSLLDSCIPQKHIENTKNKCSSNPIKPNMNCNPPSIQTNARYVSVDQKCNVNTGLETRYNNST
tara:strand:- start:3144 stop:3584 length:441 start_codon:yes stop_codon:yes gene_type:complete